MASQLWVDATRETILSYRRMIDACVEQLSDEELTHRPSAGINSVAVILRHLGGNLRSRWTDFLATDGEKPDRDRDTEFEDWPSDRQSLLDFFDQGWQALTTTIESLDDENVQQRVFIRGEAHSVPQAFQRSIAHIAYHAGQIAMIARTVHAGEWQWLSVRPGGSAEHNERTWGTPASRSAWGTNQQDEK
ncbi:MAG: DinB family protein [Planctomycetota bacterium]